MSALNATSSLEMHNPFIYREIVIILIEGEDEAEVKVDFCRNEWLNINEGARQFLPQQKIMT